MDRKKLEEIAEKLTLASSQVLLPVTIYIPAGGTEGYLREEKEAKITEGLGAGGMSPEGKYWIQTYLARTLCWKYPFIFKSFIWYSPEKRCGFIDPGTGEGTLQYAFVVRSDL